MLASTLWSSSRYTCILIKRCQEMVLASNTGLELVGYTTQWRREGVCRPGQTSVLPPPPIRSVLQSVYFSRFRTWDVNQSLGSRLFSPFPSLSPSHFRPLLLQSLRSRLLKFSYKVWGALLAPRAGSRVKPRPKLNVDF